MRKHRRAVALVCGLGMLVVSGGWASPASARPAGDPDTGGPTTTKTLDLATADAARWVVQLQGGSVAQRAKAAHAPLTATGHLDLASPVAQRHVAAVISEQDAFRTRLAAAVPKARVQRSFQTVLDGFAVNMTKAQAAAVRALPGVRAVTPDVAYHADMYATPAQIGAPAVWTALGGQATAGSGVKVAIIDSGIYVTKDGTGAYAGNPCFDDTGYSAPAGFPKGDTRFTNNKVIAARTYFRSDDPPLAGDDTAIPGPNGSSHGTHVAGTVACDANTPATISNTAVTLSGIAPHAYLMNYRVFYPSTSAEDFQTGNAYVPELVAAIEDAVKDGADVVSSSWGSTYQNTLAWPDPMVQAAEAAVDAGVTMVFANGNAGPDAETAILPASSPKVIAVGAVTKNTTISPGVVNATSDGSTPLAGTPYDVGAAAFGPQDPPSTGDFPYATAQSVATNSSALGCSLSDGSNPFPASSLNNTIAVIARGTCNFSEKVYNAQQAGAVAAFIYNSASGGDNLQTMGAGVHAADVTIPSFFLRRTDGLTMVSAANASATAGYVRQPHTATNVGDVMAGFSSRGPSADRLIKPDVVAPGVDVVSGGYNGTTFPDVYTGFGSASGTSMATPHVAGSAALLKALHPSWTPAVIKSALMSTATEAVSLGTTHDNSAAVMDRGAGRIALDVAMDAGLAFDAPSISAGERAAGTSLATTVTATDLSGSGGTWTIAPSGATAGLDITSDTAGITVPANGTAQFSITLGTAGGTGEGDYEGDVVLHNGDTGQDLHIPVWLRVVPASPTTDVLLVDDDGSAADPGFADYSAVYKGLLDGAGISYDYIEPWNDGFLSLSQLEAYRSIVYFTGDNTSFDTSGFSPANLDTITAWLNGGGRIYATGQNLAEVTDSNTDFDSARLGRSRLYHGYLGIQQDSPNAFPGGLPAAAGTGTGFLTGLKIDLTAGGDGAGNQDSVEATSPMQDTDTYNAAHTVSAIVTANGATPAGSALGHVRSSEPSLEQPRLEFLYRSLSLGFGVEGLRSDNGGVSKTALMGKTLDWLFDEVTASINPATYSSAETVTLTATAASTKGSVTKYRWDFGDGSPVVTTAVPSVEHRYKVGGTYPVRVEATDSFAHRVVAVRSLPVATGLGYRLASADGAVFSFGEKRFFGSAFGTPLQAPIVGAAPSPTGRGYWLVASDGGVFGYGDAGFFGSAGGLPLRRPVVGMATTPTGLGYWLVAADGGIFAYGDAGFFGSAGGLKLNSPVVGMAASPTGLGYWLVAADGGIFAYGDAGFFGSAGGLKLNSPVVGMAPSPTGGYWLVAADGGIFAYGDAGFAGSAGGLKLNSPVVGMASSPTGLGYWLVAADGGVFGYGDAGFLGSAQAFHSARVVAIMAG